MCLKSVTRVVVRLTDGEDWYILKVTIIEGSWGLYIPSAWSVILSPSKGPGEFSKTLPTWKFQCPNGTHCPHDLHWMMCQNEEILKMLDYPWEQLVAVPRITYVSLVTSHQGPLPKGFMQVCPPDSKTHLDLDALCTKEMTWYYINQG